MNTIQDRIRGSLIGGAIGDALGYPVEFNCFLLVALSAALRFRISRRLIFFDGWFFILHTRIRVRRRFRCHFWHSNGIFMEIIQ